MGPPAGTSFLHPFRKDVRMEQSMVIPVGLMVAWSVLVIVATVIVRIAFALAVLSDADKSPRTTLVRGGMWALATLAGGVFVAAVYWAIHNLPYLMSDRSKSPIKADAAE